MRNSLTLVISLIFISSIASSCCGKRDCGVVQSPNLMVHIDGFDSNEKSYMTIEDSNSIILQEYYPLSGDGKYIIDIDRIINNYYGKDNPIFIYIRSGVNRVDTVSNIQITQRPGTINCKTCWLSSQTQEVIYYENWRFYLNGTLVKDTPHIYIRK